MFGGSTKPLIPTLLGSRLPPLPTIMPPFPTNIKPPFPTNIKPPIPSALITQLKNESVSLQNTLVQINQLKQKNVGILAWQNSILSESENYINNVRTYISNVNKDIDTMALPNIARFKKINSDNKTKQTALDSTIAAGRNLMTTYNNVISSLQRGSIDASSATRTLTAAKMQYDKIYALMKGGGELADLGELPVDVIQTPPKAPLSIKPSNNVVPGGTLPPLTKNNPLYPLTQTNPPQISKEMLAKAGFSWPVGNVSNFSDYSGRAPAWTNSIPSWLICDWYYLLFVLNVALLIILGGMFVFASKKKLSGGRLNTLVLSIIFSSVSTLFFYLMCDRSLKPAF